jgi:hypothetical protein
VSELLRLVWGRVDAREASFTAEEVAAWPPGAFNQLSALGLLREAAPTGAVACDACGGGHIEEVIWVESPPGTGRRAYIPCPEAGRVRVPPERLRRWEVDFRQVAALTATALGVGGSAEEVAPGRAWLLGKAVLAGRPAEVFLARGLCWPDAAAVVAKLPRLLASPYPVVLSAGRVPCPDTWGAGPPVVPLSAVLSLDGDSLSIDRAHLEAAVERRGSGSATPPGACKEGPEGGRWLWWRGRRYDIPAGNVYRLLEYMWGRDSARYDGLVGPVFDSDAEPQTVRSLASKANKVLGKVGVPWRFTTDSVTRHLTKD